jgi:hypothetical protein
MSTKTSRNLRLLVINDGHWEPSVYVRRIDVIRPEDPLGDPMLRIGSWAQMVHLLHRREVPDFDLLLIDARFREDTTDPPYFNEAPMLQTLGTSTLNPLGFTCALQGLLPGDRARIPLSYTVFSSSPRPMLNRIDPVNHIDPIAAIAFTYIASIHSCFIVDPEISIAVYLAACEGQSSSEFLGVSQDPFTQSRAWTAAIGEISVQSPEDAIKAVVRKYRQQLLRACRVHNVGVNTDALGRVIASARSLATAPAGQDHPALAGRAVILYPERGEVRLNLRSLFADIDVLDAEAIGSTALPYLEELTVAAHLGTDHSAPSHEEDEGSDEIERNA